MTKEHIVTAEEPAWTKQRHRPGDDGTPEVIPNSLDVYPFDGGPNPTYSCSCGETFRRWAAVEKHFERVVNEGHVNERAVHSDQTTLSDIETR